MVKILLAVGNLGFGKRFERFGNWLKNGHNTKGVKIRSERQNHFETFYN
jgi:hypothetical protein